MLSVLDIFRIGIGPSSSHTVGPMRIAGMFIRALKKSGKLERTARVAVELQGSLALTGVGHGTVDAAILGLMGFNPEMTDPDEAADALEQVRAHEKLLLGGEQAVVFRQARDIDLAGHIIPELHPNGMKLTALNAADETLLQRTYYSTGGGFVASEAQLKRPAKGDRIASGSDVPYPFGSAAELLETCRVKAKSIEQIMLANEDAMRPRAKTIARLDALAQAMEDRAG